MSRLALLLTAAALLAAGCIAPTAIDPASTQELPMVDRLVAHTAAGEVPLPEGLDALSFGILSTPYRSGEPTVGVTSDGSIFVTAGGASVARSQDNGESWEIVGDPVFDPKTSLDPWIYVDPVTDRVFNAPLYVVCTWAAYSDDIGETWSAYPTAGCGIPAHDHQKFTAGPPAEGVTTSGYPNVLFYQYNSFRGEGSMVTRSLDGGATWSLGSVAHPSDCHGGVAGPVRAGPEGTAYLAKAACDGLNIAVSRDSGMTWEVTGKVNDVGILPALAATVDTAVDANGNAYATFTGADGLTYLTTSTDLGETWSPAKRVSPPEVGGSVFSVIQAGADGNVAIGYLATTSDSSKWEKNNPQVAPDDVEWHFYMTLSQNALDDEPVFVSQRLTPEDDPVQRGCIWLSGGGNPCRNLLDFLGSAQHEGRTYIVFADGCDKCASADQSRGAAVRIAIVETGPGLFGELLAPLRSLPVDVQPADEADLLTRAGDTLRRA